MSKGNRVFSTGAVLAALVFAFAMVGGAAAVTTSNSVAATDELAPAAPTELVVEVDLGAPAVSLSWTASPSDFLRQEPVGTDFTSGGTFVNVNDVAAYNVWRSDGGDYVLAGAVQALTYADSEVASGVTYTYRITAVDAGGNESAALESAPVSLGPPPTGVTTNPPGSIISKKARLTLGGSLDLANKTAVTQFKADLKATLAALLGISPSRIRVRTISSGSIIVDFVIDPDATGTEPTPAAAVTSLNTQVTTNPSIITETAEAEGVTTTFAAVQSLSESDVVDVDFGAIAIDGTASETFTFENTATDPDANLIINASVTGAGFAVAPATLTVAPGGTGTLDVSFAAADVQNLNGEYYGIVTIRTNDPENRETTAELTATITAGYDEPVLDLSGVALQFGSILVGASSTKTLTVTNKGDLDLEATLALTGAASFSISETSLVLTGGEAAAVSVVFSPAATGAASGTITITSNDPISPTKAVQLNGNGVAVLAGPKRGQDAQGNIILGFLDDDDDVDFDDFFAFADVFGTATGDPLFNLQADFDENGTIDFDDFFIFADNFGKVAVSFLN